MVDDAAQAQCECSELPPFIDDVYHHWMLVKRKSEGAGAVHTDTIACQ